jgi:hypothetical protein
MGLTATLKAAAWVMGGTDSRDALELSCLNHVCFGAKLDKTGAFSYH